MRWKKILVAALASGLFATSAFARQSNDTAYQTMLQNQHFLLIYQEEGTTTVKLIAADGDARIVCTGKQKKNETSWETEALYRDGKLYRFFTAEKERKARVLPLSEIDRSDLDPEEAWGEAYRMMALPKGVSVFAWNDAWGDRPASLTQPVFNGSSQRTIGNTMYDCDQYTSEIHTQAGTVSGTIAYNLLYQNGTLVKIQRYLLWNGREKLLETLNIKTLTGDYPPNTLSPWTEPVKVYKADAADFNDLMDYYVQVEELGGKPNAK